MPCFYGSFSGHLIQIFILRCAAPGMGVCKMLKLLDCEHEASLSGFHRNDD